MGNVYSSRHVAQAEEVLHCRICGHIGDEDLEADTEGIFCKDAEGCEQRETSPDKLAESPVWCTACDQYATRQNDAGRIICTSCGRHWP